MLQTYLLPPPNRPLTLPTNGSTNNPPLFDAAMTVRIAVFVDEQHVPLENEIDDDDRRSWHWVIFDTSPSPSPQSSILSPTTITSDTSYPNNDQETEKEREKHLQVKEKGRGNPIAVLRLVPPPHPPHETFSHPETAPSLPRYDLLSEPCVRITRVAVLPAYRGLGLGRKLVERAVEWAGGHAVEIQGAYERTLRIEEGGRGTTTAIEERGDGKGKGKGGCGRWEGLVLAHAQTSVEGMYARLGFECDGGLGRWVEEGIEHVGMVRRVKIAS